MVDEVSIKTLLENHIEGCEAQVKLEGNHVHVVAVSDQFAGLNAVKKQQLVYGALNHLIADGSVHAVHMQTYTPAEWQAQHS